MQGRPLNPWQRRSRLRSHALRGRPVDRPHGLVTDHPRVVTWWNRVRVTGSEVDRAPVVHLEVPVPRELEIVAATSARLTSPCVTGRSRPAPWSPTGSSSFTERRSCRESRYRARLSGPPSGPGGAFAARANVRPLVRSGAGPRCTHPRGSGGRRSRRPRCSRWSRGRSPRVAPPPGDARRTGRGRPRARTR